LAGRPTKVVKNEGPDIKCKGHVILRYDKKEKESRGNTNDKKSKESE